MAKGQNLYLKIQAKDSTGTAIIDSLDYVKTHPSYNRVAHEVDSIFKQVQKLGFLDVQRFPLKKTDSLYLSRFVLGTKYTKIKIRYDKLPLEAKTIKRLASGFQPGYFIIPFTKIEDVLRFINQEIANRGRPFSFVQLKNIQKKENGTLVAFLKTVSSKPRTIDELIVKGYEKFPGSFLKHFIGVKIGDPFNKKELEEKMQRLENLRFASSIKPPEVQFTQDSTSVYFYLQKEKSNSFDGFLGFSNNEENSTIQLTGYVNLTLRNNLNFGESLNLEYKNNGNQQIRFHARMDLPYLFQTPIGLGLGLDIFKKDSTYTTVDQLAEISYQLNTHLKTSLGYQHSESNNLLEEEEQTAGSVIEDYSADYIHIGAEYLDYSSFTNLFPIHAIFGVDLGYGNRSHAGTDSDQWFANLQAGYMFPLNQRNHIYVHNESAALFSEDYLANELYRIGGIHSIRGFAENSIFASLFSVTQTEYRYLLSANLYVHSIIDYAFYENEVLNLQENLYGIGLGFGLKTGPGILRVIFANGKADGQKFEFSNTKIHLSLTTNF